MTLSHRSLAEEQQAALDTLTPPEPAPKKHGRPPKPRPPVPEPTDLAMAEAATAALAAMEQLNARARAPLEIAAQAVAEAKARLAPVRARAAACVARLRAWEPICAPVLAQAHGLDLRGPALRLGGETALIPNLVAACANLSIVFAPRAESGGVARSTLEVLAGIPARIDRLTAADLHVCAPSPPSCGCVVRTLIADLENAETVAVQVPRTLAALAGYLTKVEVADRTRGGGELAILRAMPAGSGVTVTTPTDHVDEGDHVDV